MAFIITVSQIYNMILESIIFDGCIEMYTIISSSSCYRWALKLFLIFVLKYTKVNILVYKYLNINTLMSIRPVYTSISNHHLAWSSNEYSLLTWIMWLKLPEDSMSSVTLLQEFQRASNQRRSVQAGPLLKADYRATPPQPPYSVQVSWQFRSLVSLTKTIIL